MTRPLQTVGRVLTVTALTGVFLPLGPTVRADTVRTETALAGFAVTVEATPLRVLLDDTELQVPHDPGTAVVEADPNYTLASVSTGPNAHAITSTLWPGNLLGQGLAQLAEGSPAYPIKGEARYPDKPFDATGVDGGALSGAHASGLEASANAEGTPLNMEGQVRVGGVTARSRAVVTDKDVAVGSAVSAVQDVDLLGGIVKIGSVRTTLQTSADGTTPGAGGSTTVAGLTIAGTTFSVDDTGLHAGPQSSGLPALDSPQEVKDLLGISARTLSQSTANVPGGVKRIAGGLVIDLDTAPLRKILAPGTAVTNPILNQVIDQLAQNLPPQVPSSLLYYLVKATPHVTFIFASANSQSAASLPIAFPAFDFPMFPANPGTVVPPASGGGFTSGTPPVDLAPGGAVGTSPFLSGATNAPPPATVTGTGPATPVGSASPYVGFGGIGAARVLAALATAGLVGAGLLRLLGLAGGGLLGLGCRLGAPTSVPDLRSVTA